MFVQSRIGAGAIRSLMLAAALAMALPAFAQEAGEGERRAVPRGSRPQGDNPRQGTAVPRRETPPPAQAPPTAAPAVRSRAEERARSGARSGSVNRGNTVIVNPPPVYRNYRNYYYPRHSYPYGYGAFGLGYFYYDPYRWNPGGSYYPYGGAGYYPRVGGFGFDVGELRLQVFPRNAQVFVDGYYAGTVDDYDGVFQALKLESGAYQIRISAPGFEDLMFDVRINPGQKINYRGDLRRLGP
jgi:hypothetical protein